MPAVLIPILKVLSGPAVIWILRYVAPAFVKKLPAASQPLGAAALSALVAVLTGTDPTMSVAALVDALATFVSSLGAVKALDIAKGKTSTVTAAEKKTLEGYSEVVDGTLVVR